jgi:hypothetical protein
MRELKEYVVAEEIIEGKPSGSYTVRVNTDVNPARFIIVASFDSYEEAIDLIHYLLYKDIFI